MSVGDMDKVWPLIVQAGSRSTAALMNRKAFRKSRESGSPWLVHPATGRVLPWPGSPNIISLDEAPGMFRMELPANADLEPYGTGKPPEVDPDDRGAMNNRKDDFDGSAGILGRLAELIAERRKEMPEGSYTTHLFNGGPEKIRKKVGEEAIELVLAQDPKDVVFEAADLLYHVQVLLEALDLKWSEVEGELERRHSG